MVRPWKAITGDSRFQAMDPNQQTEMRNRWLEKVKVEKGYSSDQLSVLRSRMMGGPDIEPQEALGVPGDAPTESTESLGLPTGGGISPQPQDTGELKQPSRLQEFAYGLTGGMFPDLSAEAGYAQAPQEGIGPAPSETEIWATTKDEETQLNDIIGAAMDTGSEAPIEIHDSIKEMMGQDMTPTEILEQIRADSMAVSDPDFLPGMFAPENLIGGAGAGLKLAKGLGLPVMRTVIDEMAAGMLSIGGQLTRGARSFVRGLASGALEKNVPVERAQKMSQAIIEESVEYMNKSLGKKFPISLPARTATGGMLPEAGGTTINPPQGLEQAQQKMKQFARKEGMSKGEMDLLEKTGTIKPPGMVQVPYKGKAPIYQHESLQGMNERVRQSTGRTGVGRSISKLGSELQAEVETPIRMFEKMGGNAKKMIYDPIDDADVNAVREFIDRIKPMTKSWKKLAKSKKIGNYLVGRQEGGEEILKGMKQKVVTIDDLSPRERQVVSEMDDMYEELFGRINEARKLTGLKEISKRENYHTFYRQMDYLNDKLGYDPFTSANYDKEIANHFIKPKSTFFTSEIERKGGKIPVELDAYKTFEKYTQSALNHTYLSPEISRSRDLLNQIKKTHPENYRDASLWLDYVAGKVPQELFGGAGVKRVLNALTRNVSMSVLSFNLRSALIQPTALRNTLTDVGPLYSMKGAYKFLEQAVNPSHRKFVEKNSNLIARKYDASVEEMLKGLTGAKKKVATMGTKPLQLFDYWTANATWNSYFFKGKDAMGMTEKQAIRYANDGVVRSQASGRRAHLTKIQRTALGKAITGLQTFVINDWAFLTQDVLGLGKNVPRNKENLKKVLYYVGATSMFNSIYEDGLNINSPFGTPVRSTVDAIKEDKSYYQALWAGSSQMMETTPLVGGSLRYGSTPLGPVAETLGSAVKKAARLDMPWEEMAKGLGVPGVAQIGKASRRLDKGLSLPASILGEKIEKPVAGAPKPPKRKKPKKPKRKRGR
jgi:hypothetical protein